MTISEAIAALDRFMEAGMRARRQRAVAPIEKRLTGQLARIFKRQGADLLARAPKIAGLAEAAGDSWEDDWDAVRKQHAEALQAAVRTAAESAVEAGGKDLVKELSADVSFDLENPRAVAYLENHAASTVTGIDDTTRDRLRTLIAGAVEAGQAYDETARQIRDAFDGFSNDRAQTIAVTEAASGYVAGNLAVAADMADAGLEMEKSWLKEEDACDEICIPNADQGYIPVDEQFDSGDDGPPGHPNCRCDLLVRRVGSA
jgi:hypothetical protein